MRLRGSKSDGDDDAASAGAVPAAGPATSVSAADPAASVSAADPARDAADSSSSGTPIESESAPVDSDSDSAPVESAAGASTAPNMLPGRARRRLGVERLLMRVIATAGIVGIGVVIAAILAASNVQGWIIGLAVALVAVVLSAILWSSRQL